MVIVKFVLHWIRDLVDGPHLPLLFDLVEFLSGSEWWWSNINELDDGCWTAYLNRVLLVVRMLS